MALSNTDKITHLMALCLRHSLPLDKASLSIDSWSDNARLTFDAKKLTGDELRTLKRACDFKVQGDVTSPSKSLEGFTKHGEGEPKLWIKVESALTCTKVTYDGLSAQDMERVIEDFRQGKAFIMDCEPATGMELEPTTADETTIEW